MLDHMIDKGELKPLVVVAPTYYPPGKKDQGIAYSGEAVRDFGPLMLNKILPLVEAVEIIFQIAQDVSLILFQLHKVRLRSAINFTAVCNVDD